MTIERIYIISSPPSLAYFSNVYTCTHCNRRIAFPLNLPPLLTINGSSPRSECNCHNKAEDCYYNQTVADLKISMNTLGQFVGGGVCLNCTQNTAGVNCETCADSFYRPHKVRSPIAPYPPFPVCSSRGSFVGPRVCFVRHQLCKYPLFSEGQLKAQMGACPKKPAPVNPLLGRFAAKQSKETPEGLGRFVLPRL